MFPTTSTYFIVFILCKVSCMLNRLPNVPGCLCQEVMDIFQLSASVMCEEISLMLGVKFAVSFNKGENLL